MVYVEINRKNGPSVIEKLNKYLSDKDAKIFMLIYMEGCGPCNATRPEWAKLKNVLSSDLLKREDIVVVSIDKDLLGKIKNFGSEPNGFPTIRYIENKGTVTEDYEDADIGNKDRTIDSFVDWIKHKSEYTGVTKTDEGEKEKKEEKEEEKEERTKGGRGRRTRRRRRWSLKRKRSIRCRKPRGFSQRQYCKYGRKK